MSCILAGDTTLEMRERQFGYFPGSFHLWGNPERHARHVAKSAYYYTEPPY